MATGRSLVLTFSLPASVRPSDVIAWIGQMLATHSGVQIAIERAPKRGGRAYQVVAEPDAADLVRGAWRDNAADWRETGAEIVH